MADDPKKYPLLGRLIGAIVGPEGTTRFLYLMAAICLGLFLLDFTYEKHGHFNIENRPGFYGFYGFVMFTGLILLAKGLRVLIKRPEDYYGDKAVDTEAYPEDQLGKVDYDA